MPDRRLLNVPALIAGLNFRNILDHLVLAEARMEAQSAIPPRSWSPAACTKGATNRFSLKQADVLKLILASGLRNRLGEVAGSRCH
jgi:hypothetical protein